MSKCRTRNTRKNQVTDASRFRSPVNTWQEDWKPLGWNDVPDRLKADSYLDCSISKEEWEEDMLQMWHTRRLSDIDRISSQHQ